MKEKHNLGALRKSYEKGGLSDKEKSQDPLKLFKIWFSEAQLEPSIEEANAMSIVTLGADEYPKARIVLLKHFDSEGFVFYTNYTSAKGQAIVKYPRVGISFFWPALERQVIICGDAEKLPPEMSDTYFDSRPLGSRLGAIASPQSKVIENRSELEANLKELEAKYSADEPKRPDHWGGYLVRPVEIEFWQGRPNRLHDRLRFSQTAEQKWTAERLAP